MQAAEQTVAVARNEFNPERDGARKVGTRKCRVHNRNTANLTFGQFGNMPPVGVSEVWLYEDEIEVFRRQLVEHEPDKLELARATFERLIADEVRENLSGGWSGEIADLVSAIKAGTDVDIKDEYARVLDVTEHSIESTFQMMFKRDIKPLVSIEVAGDPLPAPTTKAREEEGERMKLLVREAFLAVSDLKASGDADPRIAAIEKQLAEVTRQNGELLAQLKQRK